MMNDMNEDLSWYWMFMELRPIGENVEIFYWDDGGSGDNPGVLSNDNRYSFAWGPKRSIGDIGKYPRQRQIRIYKR